jgi:N-acetylneuraminate synthase
MMSEFYNKLVNSEYPYIITEIGANHNGDIKLAKEMIDKAKECGCDAVKFQSWSKKSIFTQRFYKEQNQLTDKNFGTLEEMVEKFSLSKKEHIVLKEYCDNKKITFCSTPFTPEEVDMLDELEVPFFKVASMDLNNLSFLKYVAEKGKTIILSTGMGSLAEIEIALNTIYETGNKEVILLHCIAIYPPDDEIINLRNIEMLNKTFNVPVGFSDHTIGTSIPLAAITLGAKVIEKHFTLDKTMPGWDHAVSATPDEMKVIVEEGKRIVTTLGKYKRIISKAEINQRNSFRRSILSNQKLRKGEVLKESKLNFKRPGTGIRPDEIKYILGRKVNKDIDEDELIKWEDLN